jgi:hypothetical protein
MTIATDILDDLQNWLKQIREGKDYKQVSKELPGVEMALVSRAIDEIKRLRSKKTTTADAIPIDQLTSANDK